MTPFASRDLMVKVLDATTWEGCKPGAACSNDGTEDSADCTPILSEGCDKVAGERDLADLQAQLEEQLARV